MQSAKGNYSFSPKPKNHIYALALLVLFLLISDGVVAQVRSNPGEETEALANAITEIGYDITDAFADALADTADGIVAKVNELDRKQRKEKNDREKIDGAVAAEALAAEAFAKAIPGAFCKCFIGCKNEEIALGVQTFMVMTVGFGALSRPDKPEMYLETQSVMKSINYPKLRKRNAKLNTKQCGVVSRTAATVIGLDKKTLSEAVKARRVTFNAAQAQKCLRGLKNVKSCKTWKKVGRNVDYVDNMDEMMRPYKDELERITEACVTTLVGQVDVGGMCVVDYECKEGLTCKGDSPTGKERWCSEP